MQKSKCRGQKAEGKSQNPVPLLLHSYFRILNSYFCIPSSSPHRLV